MNLEKIAREYFTFFSKKDIDNLTNFFSNEIKLRDWDINEKGIKNVTKANIKIFNNAETIDVKILKIYSLKMTIIAELEITINKKVKILVVDIIEFNSSNKIIEIRAYKGN